MYYGGGSPQRSDYTFIGRVASPGAHIYSKAGAGQLLISQATDDLVCDSVQAALIPGLHLKGVEQPGTAYRITRGP